MTDKQTGAIIETREALHQAILTVEAFNKNNQITEKGKDYLSDWKASLQRLDNEVINAAPDNLQNAIDNKMDAWCDHVITRKAAKILNKGLRNEQPR